MGIRPSLLELPRNRTDAAGRPWRYPPAFFVGMARDTAMADWIELDAEKLKSQVREAGGGRPRQRPAPACNPAAAPRALPVC